MLTKHLLALCASAMLLGACGENKSEEKSTANDSAASTKTADQASSEKKVLSDIKVTIKNGELAGTYEAKCREGCTSYGIAGEKVFGNQYSESGKGPKELSSVQLIVDDVTGDKDTKEFTLTVSFGELFGEKSTTYNINTRNGAKDGSGTLDLKYSGDKAKVKIDGTTKTGVGLEVQIDANKVGTLQNITEN